MDAETLKRIDAFLTEHGQTLKTVPRARLTQFQKTDASLLIPAYHARPFITTIFSGSM